MPTASVRWPAGPAGSLPPHRWARPRALPAEQAAQAARPYCAQVEVIEAPSQAAQRALELALEHQGMAIACGSLYMIGEAKQGFCSAAPLVD